MPRVGNEVVLSSSAPLGVQSLIEALDEFEPGLPLVREQPGAEGRVAIRPRR